MFVVLFLPLDSDGGRDRAKRSIILDLNTDSGLHDHDLQRRRGDTARQRELVPPHNARARAVDEPPGVEDERRRARRTSTFERVAAADRQTSCSARPQTSKISREAHVEAQDFNTFISVRDERKELVRRVAHGLGEDEAVLGTARREGVLLRLLDALPQYDPFTVDRDAAAVSTN